MKKVKFKDEELTVDVTKKYENGRPVIMLFDNMGIPYMKASVNLPMEYCPAGHTHIKNYSENEGIMQALESANIVKRAGRLKAGYGEVFLAKILI